MSLFDLFSLRLRTPEEVEAARAAAEKAQREQLARIQAGAVAWSANLKFQPLTAEAAATRAQRAKSGESAVELRYYHKLYIKADTYKVYDLFPESAVFSPQRRHNFNEHADNVLPKSADGKFAYGKIPLPLGTGIYCCIGRTIGMVYFDAPIAIPVLWEHHVYGWEETPWMSLTPNEYLTLTPGTKQATGRVVIGGLGLGHQLIEVSKKRSVKEIILIERSGALIDWLMPRIQPLMGPAPLRVVRGDIFAPTTWNEVGGVVDAAIIDVFPVFGNNGPQLARIQAVAASASGVTIKKWWGWGTLPVAQQ